MAILDLSRHLRSECAHIHAVDSAEHPEIYPVLRHLVCDACTSSSVPIPR